MFRMRWIAISLLALAVGIPTTQVSAEEGLVYELRTYTCHPGRLPALHARFKNHTMKLFEKHGMKNVMYWVPVDKEDTLIYVIAHESQETAAKSWKAFISDPEWKAAQTASEQDGKIVLKVEKQFLKRTEYSP